MPQIQQYMVRKCCARYSVTIDRCGIVAVTTCTFYLWETVLAMVTDFVSYFINDFTFECYQITVVHVGLSKFIAGGCEVRH